MVASAVLVNFKKYEFYAIITIYYRWIQSTQALGKYDANEY